MGASAENTATFAIDFQANGAVVSAGEATGALKKLGAQLDDDTAALGAMQKALRNLQGGTSVNIQAFQNLKKSIEAKKATIAQTQEKFLALGGTFKKTKPAADATGDSLKELFEHMQKGGGPLGGLASRLQGLRGLLAGGGALVVGAVAFTAALFAIAAAATIAAAALLKYGIAAADAYRSERLQLEGLTKVRNWYGIAAGKAEDLQGAIDRVSGSVSLGRDELLGLERSLYQSGLRGGALENALQGVATATDAAGESQGAFAKQLYMAYGRTAEGAKKVSEDIKARFGGVVAAKMLSLTVQTKKLKENFDALFRGLKIETFLAALKSITDLFSQNTASGRALKQLLEIALQPLIDGLSTAGPLAKRFFQGAVLGAQELTIAYYDVRLSLQRTFGDLGIRSNVDGLTFALNAGKFALFTFAAGLAIVAAGAALIAAPFFLAGYYVAKWVDTLWTAAKAIKEIDWTGLGKSLIDGFVNGITNGIGRVVDAVRKMGNAALETLRHALDSHSPSRKGFSVGFTYPQGAALGVEKGVPLVQKASIRLGAAIEKGREQAAPKPSEFTPAPTPLTPQVSTPAQGARPDGAASTGPIEVKVEVNIHGAKGEDVDEEMIRRVVREEIPPAFRQALESVHVSLGSS